MENLNEQFVIEQKLQAMSLQERVSKAGDAWVAIQSDQWAMKFRQEVSRILGIYISDPTVYNGVIDGIHFRLHDIKGGLIASMMYEGRHETSNVIHHLSELGGWLQYLDLNSSCEEEELTEEEKQAKYGHIFVSAPEYLKEHSPD